MSAPRPSADAPLLAWGAARETRRQRRLRRLRLGIPSGAALILLAMSSTHSAAPRLVWNASASVPIGLYRVWPGDPPARGEMAVARVPQGWRALAAERHYLPANVPLVKRVAADSGDLVCATGTQVLVNGKHAATRLAHDPNGRALPWWQGCHRLSADEYLLLTDAPGGFDGRYFGISRAHDLVGRARLIWRR